MAENPVAVPRQHHADLFGGTSLVTYATSDSVPDSDAHLYGFHGEGCDCDFCCPSDDGPAKKPGRFTQNGRRAEQIGLDLQHNWQRYECGVCSMPTWRPNSCGNRFCTTCQQHRHIRAKRRLKKLLECAPLRRNESIRFVTLTIDNVYRIQDGIDRLRKSFKKLRNYANWKRYVTGGIFVIEVVPGSNGWHVHAHVAVAGVYYPQEELSNDWLRASGCRIADIRKSDNRCFRELAKYMSKPPDCSASYHQLISEAMRNVRLFQTFGCLFKLQITVPKEPHRCECCGYENELIWTPEVSYAYDRQIGAP